MRKMKTLFVRNYYNKHAFSLTEEVEKGCEWVINGEGVATRKWDGTCCCIIDGELYKRYNHKPGKKIPTGAIPCQKEADRVTGSLPFWVQCDRLNPIDKWFFKAFDSQSPLYDGTYELVGVHVNGNIDRVSTEGDILIKHGMDILEVGRSFEDIKKYLAEHEIEGIVFHRGNGDMCKIKRSDFGFPWGRSRR